MRFFVLLLTLGLFSFSIAHADEDEPQSPKVCFGAEALQIMRDNGRPDAQQVDGDKMMLGWQIETKMFDITFQQMFDQQWHVISVQICDDQGERCQPVTLFYCGNWNEA